MKDKVIIENLYNRDKLTRIYDTCNKIFKDERLFYTKEEVEKLRKTKKFI